MYKCISCSNRKEEIIVRGKWDTEKRMFECPLCGSNELELRNVDIVVVDSYIQQLTITQYERTRN